MLRHLMEHTTPCWNTQLPYYSKGEQRGCVEHKVCIYPPLDGSAGGSTGFTYVHPLRLPQVWTSADFVQWIFVNNI